MRNKGYRKIFTGATNEIYVALDQMTGDVCLATVNQGSQHFKEIVLPDTAIDYLFSLVYENAKYEEPTETIEHTDLADSFTKLQDYKYIMGSKRNFKEVVLTNETLIKNITDEKIISILQVSYVDKILANVLMVNLTYEELTKFTEYLIDLAKKAQDAQKQENASKNEQDADVRPIENKEEE